MNYIQPLVFALAGCISLEKFTTRLRTFVPHVCSVHCTAYANQLFVSTLRNAFALVIRLCAVCGNDTPLTENWVQRSESRPLANESIAHNNCYFVWMCNEYPNAEQKGWVSMHIRLNWMKRPLNKLYDLQQTHTHTLKYIPLIQFNQPDDVLNSNIFKHIYHRIIYYRCILFRQKSNFLWNIKTKIRNECVDILMDRVCVWAFVCPIMPNEMSPSTFRLTKTGF